MTDSWLPRATQIDAGKLILCTGSSPISGPLPVSHLIPIYLNVGLTPTLLSKTLPTDAPAHVGVVVP